jgi:hypothetical protein
MKLKVAPLWSPAAPAESDAPSRSRSAEEGADVAVNYVSSERPPGRRRGIGKMGAAPSSPRPT